MPKRPHPPPTRRKKTPKAPETADEYLAVAVDLEESGERWRSGDVAKAGRFFVQAITAYETTLARYPNNFDARYNRARLLYTLTQLPLPATFFPATSTAESRLFAAVEAHKECNDLEKNSSDILFNYGQTLSSLGEFYANKPQSYNEQSSELEQENEDEGEEEEEEEPPGKEIERLLRSKEAFETSWSILQQCLTVQESDYKSTLEQSQSFENISASSPPNDEYDMNDEEEAGYHNSGGGVKLSKERRSSTTSSHSSNSGNSGGGNSGNNTQWAAIVEPTTKLTILDTALAMLDVQTSILNLSTPSSATSIFSQEPPQYLDQLTTHASTTLNNYILPISGSLHLEPSLNLEPPEIVEKGVEAVLARANFLTALAETRYYLGLSTPETWEAEVNAAFEPFALYSSSSSSSPPSSSPTNPPTEGGIIDLTTSWMGLCDRSTAYTTLSTTLTPNTPALATKSWKLATIASQDLSAATKLSPEKERPGVFLARGNLEMIRSRIPVEAAERGREVLRRNAGVYYRGVVAASGSSLIGAVDGVKVKEAVVEARVKEAVIKVEEDGDTEGLLLSLVKKGGVKRATVRRIVRAAVEEGVFGRDVLGAVENVLRS